LLDGEFTDDGGNVVRVETTPVPGEEFQVLTVVLQQGVTYDLQLARAGVGTNVARTEAAYLTDTEGNGSRVPETGSTELTVEVRDRFDNPVGGTVVAANTSRSDSSVSPASSESDSNGEVTLTYQAPDDISGVNQVVDRINASINVSAAAAADTSFDASTPQNVTMVVTVDNSDNSGLASGGGGGPYALNWLDPTQAGVSCDPANDPNGVCTVDAGQTNAVTLPVGTNPTVDGATVEFAVNDTGVGTVSPSTNTTNNTGETTTTLTPKAEGGLTVFATSGGGGDRLTVEVVNATSIESVGETRTISTPGDGSWETVNFDGTYADPVVIAKPLSFEDTEPASVRLRNVQSGSFEFKVEDWGDSHATSENLTYIAFEKGTHTLANGSQVVAGDRSISGGGFQPVTYDTGFGSTAPVVFSQPQTVNDPTPVVTRHENVNPNGYDLKLQESEGAGQTGHGSERVGYIAIEQNTSNNRGSLWETDTTPDGAVFGVGDYGFDPNNFEQVTFTQSFSGPPAVIAQAQTQNGGNTAWERIGTRNASDFRVAMDEETTSDGERNHGGSETVAYFAFEEEGGIFTSDTTPPTISDFNATNPSGQDVQVSFNASEQLNRIEVDITGAETATLTESDFTETNNGGTFTYVATYSGSSDGDYTAELRTATDSAGNDGAGAETDTVTVDTTPPTITSASITNAPISQADAGNPQTVTVEFSEAMDTSVAPTVEITGLPSGTYAVSQDSYSGSTWEGTVTIPDNDEEATAAISVSGAQDPAGNVQDPNPDDSNTFEVDTVLPQDPNDTAISPALIDASDDENVEVDVEFPNAPESGTVFVRLTDENGDSVTANANSNTGGRITTVSGIDISGLDDGTITAEARIEDGAGNENPAGFTAESTAQKDTTAPSITNFDVANPEAQNVTVTFDSDEELTDTEVSISGAESATLTTADFTETDNGDGTFTYDATYQGSSDGDYTATLEKAEDSFGNDGASGRSDTVTVDTAPPGVSSASITSAPINDTDTQNAQTVTVNFNQTMNQAIDPTVEITGLTTDYPVPGTWTDSTTWEGAVNITDAGENATAAINVSGAEDTAGTVQSPNPDDSNTFRVDTENPQDPTETRIRPDPINASTQDSVSVDVNFSTTPEAGTVFVELVGPNGTTVTANASTDTTDTTTTLTGINVTVLDDGTVNVTARVEDWVGNENPAGFTAQSSATKDTTQLLVLSFVEPPFSGSIDTGSYSDASAPRGTEFLVRATKNSTGVENTGVTYTSNDTGVATVDASGVTNATGYNATTVTWQGDGRVNVTATNATAVATVNVTVDRLLSESFEAPEETLVANGWFYNDSGNGGDAGIKGVGSTADDGTRVAYINGDTADSSSTDSPADSRAIELNYTVDTSNYDAVTVSYVPIEPDGVDDADEPDSGSNWVPGENLRLQYRASDGSWVTADNVSAKPGSDPESQYRRATISVPDAFHSGFEIRFRQGDTTAADEWQIDSVQLTGISTDPVSNLNQGPVAAYRFSPSEPTTADTVTFDGARSDDPDGSISSYEWDFDGDGTTDATGKSVTHSYSSAGTFDATLTVNDGGATDTSTQTITVRGPISAASVKSLVPNASNQKQRINVTVGTDLPSTETIQIDLSSAQAPGQVDYQSSGLTVVKGPSASTLEFSTQETDNAVINYTPNSDVSAGTSIEFRVGSISVGPPSTQGNPYSVSVNRTDGGSATTDFRVDRNTGTSELRNLDVTNLTPNMDGQPQRIVFETTTELPAGDTVSIDLFDAQDTGTEVNYGNADSPEANVTKQDLSFTDQNSNNASIRYTAPSGGLPAGTTVQINVTGVNTDAMNGAPYVVGFSRSDADTASTTFDARQPGAGIAFVGQNSGTLSSYHTGEYVVDYGVAASAVGPKTFDFDGNGEADIPYIRGETLYLTDSQTGERQVANKFSGGIAVGAFDGDGATGTFIYAADSKNGKIERVKSDGNTTDLTGGNINADAIGGIADIDGDAATELVYVGTSQQVRYLDDNGTAVNTGEQVGSNNGGIGIGTPADFDGDGTARIPIVDQNNNVDLVTESGTTTELATDASVKSALAAFDTDGDGDPEIVYLDKNNNRALTSLEIDGTTTVLRDIIGDIVRGTEGPGAG